jgi:DNA-binding transcriptional LysR family regulator
MNTNITLRQLRAFRAVGHEGSFTRAAARLRLTQSALSIAVQSLEAELGLRLLDRSTRSVTPTLHGLRLLGLADRVLDELERGVEDLRAHAERARGQVAVSVLVMDCTTTGWFPPMVIGPTRTPTLARRE